MEDGSILVGLGMGMEVSRSHEKDAQNAGREFHCARRFLMNCKS